MFNLHSTEVGNYFYLRRDIPLLVKDITDPADVMAHPLWKQGKINYVIAWPKDTAVFAKHHLEQTGLVHGLGIYRLKQEQSDPSAQHR